MIKNASIQKNGYADPLNYALDIICFKNACSLQFPGSAFLFLRGQSRMMGVELLSLDTGSNNFQYYISLRIITRYAFCTYLPVRSMS